MKELSNPFWVYNTEWKQNFLIKYTNEHNQFIDENKVVHNKAYLITAKEGLKVPIEKAGLK